jgi:hypothetical protein
MIEHLYHEFEATIPPPLFHTPPHARPSPRRTANKIKSYAETSAITIGGTCFTATSSERTSPFFARYKASSMLGAVS